MSKKAPPCLKRQGGFRGVWLQARSGVTQRPYCLFKLLRRADERRTRAGEDYALELLGFFSKNMPRVEPEPRAVYDEVVELAACQPQTGAVKPREICPLGLNELYRGDFFFGIKKRN